MTHATAYNITCECSQTCGLNIHCQILCCGFPGGHNGNFMGGESVAMAAHPASVIPPDWQEKLWETHPYSLQIIFVLTRHVIPPDLSGLDFRWCALTMLIPNHESLKACGRGGNVTSPGFVHTHRFQPRIRDVSGREKKKTFSLNVSQNLYYNRYSVEMFCEINTLYSRRRS